MILVVNEISFDLPLIRYHKSVITIKPKEPEIANTEIIVLIKVLS